MSRHEVLRKMRTMNLQQKASYTLCYAHCVEEGMSHSPVFEAQIISHGKMPNQHKNRTINLQKKGIS